MSKLLFNLRNVPDDEADEVRELLEREGFDTYETRPSPFGISSGAIWIRDEAQHTDAKRVLDAYQAERAQRARVDSETSRLDGTAPTLMSVVRTQPLAVALLALAIAVVLAVSAWPFLWLAR